MIQSGKMSKNTVERFFEQKNIVKCLCCSSHYNSKCNNILSDRNGISKFILKYFRSQSNMKKE
jgi:hypothetical protein